MPYSWKLPEILRPSHRYYQVEPGFDFPTWFTDALKAIDDKFYLVRHPYRVLWDHMFMNQYYAEDRYSINTSYNALNFGYVLTDGEGNPIKDDKWHLWRLAWPYGWAHIFVIDYPKDYHYLKTIITRLFIEAQWVDTYGPLSYSHFLNDIRQEKSRKLKEGNDSEFADIQKENAWFLRKVKENMDRGITAATDPKKEIISSFKGKQNKSRIIHPLSDTEGGLIVPGN